jgi:hypothetical protein
MMTMLVEREDSQYRIPSFLTIALIVSMLHLNLSGKQWVNNQWIFADFKDF